MNWTRKRVAERWGMPFWDIVRDLEAQGLNRRQASEALGMDKDGFTMLLRQNPAQDPWGSSNVVATYVRDTGEQFGDALRRMAAEGYGINAASCAIGFKGTHNCHGLKYAMRVRGIEVEFKRKDKAPKPKTGTKTLAVTRGWPTWGRVYELTQGASTGA